MVPLINKTDNFKMNHKRELLESERLKQWHIECDLGSEKVIILTARFCKVVTGFR